MSNRLGIEQIEYFRIQGAVIRLWEQSAIMPQEAEVAVVHLDFGDEALAEEIGFVLREVHVVFVAQRAVHDGKRMKREWRQLVRLRVYPSHGTRSLQAETGTISKAHREIVGVTCISQPLHMVNVATQIVRAEHAAVFDFRDVAVITAMHAQIRVVVAKHVFQALIIASPQAILRIVEAFAFCSFDKIDGVSTGHFRILFNKPWESV